MTGDLAHSLVPAADAGLRQALTEANLPVDDLDVSNGRFFRFERNGVLAGYGGFEPYGGDALLRSLVVTPQLRGTGAGRAIIDELAHQMRGAGVANVYLLTTAAETFFRHLGFAPIERNDAPPAILATPQASTICSSAPMLSKRL